MKRSLSSLAAQLGETSKVFHIGLSQRRPMANSPKHADPHYRRVAPIVRANAYANPNTRCRRCGLTLEERQALHPHKRITWDCGHPAPYAPEHSDCNRAAGATDGNRQREPRSRRWTS